MSSSVFIKFEQPIRLDNWLSFCDLLNIIYSPRTAGQNVFYAGEVEIAFSRPVKVGLPRLSSGELDFDAARPKDEADVIRVSSYWMTNLESIARIALSILSYFGGTYTCSPELESFLRLAPAQ